MLEPKSPLTEDLEEVERLLRAVKDRVRFLPTEETPIDEIEAARSTAVSVIRRLCELGEVHTEQGCHETTRAVVVAAMLEVMLEAARLAPIVIGATEEASDISLVCNLRRLLLSREVTPPVIAMEVTQLGEDLESYRAELASHLEYIISSIVPQFRDAELRVDALKKTLRVGTTTDSQEGNGASTVGKEIQQK